jgi:excisionase family DNA binding protein
MPIDPSIEILAEDRYFSTHEVSGILGVTPSSIVKWVKLGRLKAFSTPGGHRRIAAADLVRFAQEQGMPIPKLLRELTVSKVLAVDDEPRFLRALENAFRPHADEFQVATADNGVDGLVLVGSLKPDFLLLDINMPRTDGFDVLKRLKSSTETRAMTVVVISGGIDAATEAKCKKLGAAMCLPKPFSNAELLEALRELRKPRGA